MAKAKGSSPFEALADETRRAILRRLRGGSLTAGEIAESFHLTKPTLSHHFRVLREAGLVRAERRGTSIVYALQTNVLEDLAAELLDLADRARARKPKGAST
ncbi:Transcriptional regulator, ArsR family [Labilithrix luteola]|uniref:Transcriptional regulator, ArsR family n=1 Tax=Labilithrix luteola TaxID=1391654 RepID=A0A0K1PW21_9BACT|nr:autorepressor SdpR family transcription factor [Labilithrix luteola]AKU97713.1 Transcriptional regulator, ArsR family [Labilithrix luteola]